MAGLALFQLACMWCVTASDRESTGKVACGPTIGERFVFSLVGEGPVVEWGGLGLGAGPFHFISASWEL